MSARVLGGLLPAPHLLSEATAELSQLTPKGRPGSSQDCFPLLEAGKRNRGDLALGRWELVHPRSDHLASCVLVSSRVKRDTQHSTQNEMCA